MTGGRSVLTDAMLYSTWPVTIKNPEDDLKRTSVGGGTLIVPPMPGTNGNVNVPMVAGINGGNELGMGLGATNYTMGAGGAPGGMKIEQTS